jgi:GDP-L-fucose synthase
MSMSEKIYVAGHRGLVGSAIVRALKARGQDAVTRTHAELDLCDQAAVNRFFATEKPTHIYLAAAKVGGIHANNTYRADFIYQNLMMAANIIHAAHANGARKLLFLGSSCIYPRLCPQPMKEEHLLSGPLEQTNEPYAIAKIAGLKLCESYHRQYGCDFVTAMPTNLYGPGDNYDLQNSHVLPALLRKFHEAKERGNVAVPVWGTGAALREFLHVDDLAEASLFIMDRISAQEVSIRALAELVQKTVGHTGDLAWDASKPDGTPRKLLDTARLTGLGWKSRITLADGLRSTYAHFLAHDRQRFATAAH